MNIPLLVSAGNVILWLKFICLKRVGEKYRKLKENRIRVYGTDKTLLFLFYFSVNYLNSSKDKMFDHYIF